MEVVEINEPASETPGVQYWGFGVWMPKQIQCLAWRHQSIAKWRLQLGRDGGPLQRPIHLCAWTKTEQAHFFWRSKFRNWFATKRPRLCSFAPANGCPKPTANLGGNANRARRSRHRFQRHFSCRRKLFLWLSKPQGWRAQQPIVWPQAPRCGATLANRARSLHSGAFATTKPPHLGQTSSIDPLAKPGYPAWGR